jgi:hypothetical protein
MSRTKECSVQDTCLEQKNVECTRHVSRTKHVECTRHVSRTKECSVQDTCLEQKNVECTRHVSVPWCHPGCDKYHVWLGKYHTGCDQYGHNTWCDKYNTTQNVTNTTQHRMW